MSLADEIIDEKRRREDRRSYQCNSCSSAIVVEDIITAADYQVEDPSGEVRYLVGYKFTCPNEIREEFYDAPSATSLCKKGDDIACRSCESCKYGEPVIVGIRTGCHKTGDALRWSDRVVSPKCSMKRLFYKCTNRKHMKQYDKGTVMSSYIRCECYEEEKRE